MARDTAADEEEEALRRFARGEIDFQHVNLENLPVTLDRIYKHGIFFQPILVITGGLDTSNDIRPFKQDTSGRQVTRTDTAYPVEFWPGGTILSYKRKALNDGANAGDHVTLIEPVDGSPIMIDFIAVWNMDTSSRNVSIGLATAGGTTVDDLVAVTSTGAGAHQQWPAAADVGISRLMHTIDWEITMTNAAVAVSQDSYFFYQFRYFGADPPNVTETGPTDVTWSDIT